MQRKDARLHTGVVFIFLGFCLNQVVGAQPTGVLYEPEPPVDSAYVRVMLASPEGAVDVLVDGRARIGKLGAGNASDYMVLTAGNSTLALHPAGKSVAYLSTTLDVVKGHAMTVAFTALKSNAIPVVFEDKTNSNKLKALLAVYHLDPKAGPLDVLTADGRTKVFSNMVYGASSSIQVNPISIELMVAKAGDKAAQANTSLAMTQGGAYSVLLLPGEGGQLVVRATQNKIEAYKAK